MTNYVCMLTQNSKLESSEEYQMHVKYKKKKKECKKIFLEYQKLCKDHPAYLYTNFHTQKVLKTPHGKSVTLFYSRKYSFNNESI